jgi:hypothetical protein
LAVLCSLEHPHGGTSCWRFRSFEWKGCWACLWHEVFFFFDTILYHPLKSLHVFVGAEAALLGGRFDKEAMQQQLLHQQICEGIEKLPASRDRVQGARLYSVHGHDAATVAPCQAF